MSKVIGSYADSMVRMSAVLNFSIDKWELYFSPERNTSLMKMLANEIIGDIKKRFEKGYGYKGRWRKKKAITQAYEGGADKTLIYTGRLMDSFQYIYTAGEIMVYTKNPYAHIHNFGCAFDTTKRQTVWMWANLFNKDTRTPATAYHVTIPQREFMYFTKDLLERINKIILIWIQQAERLGT